MVIINWGERNEKEKTLHTKKSQPQNVFLNTQTPYADAETGPSAVYSVYVCVRVFVCICKLNFKKILI